MKAVQIGVAGFGKSWRPGLTSTPGVDVVALVDTNHEVLEDARQFYGLSKDQCYTDPYADWFESSDADFAVISVPHADHYDCAVRAFRHGMDAIVVKPLSDRFDHAARMVREAEQNGRKLVVAQQLRFHPPVLELRRLLAERRVGDIAHIDVQAWFGRRGPVRDKWHQQYPLLVEAAIHHVDLVRWVSGLDAASVIADTWNMPWHDDAWGLKSATCLYRMNNEARFLFQGISTERSEKPYPGSFTIDGTDGTIQLVGGRIYVDNEEVWPGAAAEPHGLNLREGNAEVVRQAVDFFSNTRDTSLSGRDNLRSLAMVFGAIVSFETGTRVELDNWTD